MLHNVIEFMYSQLYFEQNLQEELENFGWDPEKKRYDPSVEELDSLLSKIKVCPQ